MNDFSAESDSCSPSSSSLPRHPQRASLQKRCCAGKGSRINTLAPRPIELFSVSMLLPPEFESWSLPLASESSDSLLPRLDDPDEVAESASDSEEEYAEMSSRAWPLGSELENSAAVPDQPTADITTRMTNCNDKVQRRRHEAL